MRMHSRAGFALPVAIFVIGFLTVGVAAAFTRVDNEARVNRDRDAEIDAFGIAESGLQYYMTNRRALGLDVFPPPPAESVRITLPGGYADVVAHRLRPKNGAVEAMYYVRSRATAIRGTASSTPPAQRTVSNIAIFREESMQVKSAWTSLSGLQKNGTAGTIDGNDYCKDASNNPMAPPVAGIAVPDDLYEESGSFVPVGSPPVDEMGTKAQMANAIKIEWDEIINNNAIVPDIEIPPTTNWPTQTEFDDPDFWPVIKVTGNGTLDYEGKGILIVTGDLTINGSKMWQGVVLVGGTVTSNGNNSVEGAVISGLNEKINPGTVPMQAIANGNKEYVYHSCNIANALSRISVLRPIPGSWADNYSSW
jgi:hypothetical protein